MHVDVAVPLSALIDALDSGVAAVGDWDGDPPIAGVALIDAAEAADGDLETPADLVLLVGVDAAALRRWWARFADPAGRPHALITKDPAVAAAAAAIGAPAVTLHAQTRWDRVLGVLQDRLDRVREPTADRPTPADLDLVGLVALIAQGTGGLVSVEDPTSTRVLAYSPSRGEADELRVQTILGRGGPPEYLALLRRWGVFEAIRRGGEVVDVPDHPERSWRRRMVIGVQGPGRRQLGSIWVQEGDRPLAASSGEVLRGAAAVAARILTREAEAPSTETQLVQRVFGEHGGIDAGSAGAYLRLPPAASSALVGLGLDGDGGPESAAAMAGLAGALRLRASAFAPAAVSGVIGPRAYLLLPEAPPAALTSWVNGLIVGFDDDPAVAGTPLRAVIVTPVAGLAAVPAARAEADRVLTATAQAGADTDRRRVTTLAESRTAVLLAEIAQQLAGRPELVDPRLTLLREYDAAHRAALVASVRAWLDAHGNVRDAATVLGIHDNTLRYRLERAQAVSGLSLDQPDDRLLLTVQLVLADPG